MPNDTMFFSSADGVHFEPCEPQDCYAGPFNVALPKAIGEARIELKNDEKALTRYANSITGASDRHAHAHRQRGHGHQKRASDHGVCRAERGRMMDEPVYYEDEHPFSGLLEEE